MILNTVLFCAGQRGNNEGAEEWGGARQVCLRLRLLQPHRGGLSCFQTISTVEICHNIKYCFLSYCDVFIN